MHTARRAIRPILAAALVLVGLAGALQATGTLPLGTWRATAVTTAVPGPAVDEPRAPGAQDRTAVLAGGCFWGVPGVFQHVTGVREAESGYAGGAASTADYETVSTGNTGHAESVRITYDPGQITFGELLRIYFTVVADPTQLNRQGPDEGSQYRSVIFAQNPDQHRIALAYIDQLDHGGVFAAPIVTTVAPSSPFYPAETYHQNFLAANPDDAYIARFGQPKLDALARLFPDRYRAQPILVPVADN